jgi:3-deoxy-D-manno-octulosonic-acid transferase
VIWINAVGLGEVMALRGLIAALQAARPELNFLVTSSTLASAETFEKNLPPRTLHQFLPLDTPLYTKRFLDHWQPNLALWSEQDIWPGIVTQAARRGIPQALINLRMAPASFRRKRMARLFFRALYQKFDLISAQDAQSAAAVTELSQRQDIQIGGSLKPHCPPLAYKATAQQVFLEQVGQRPIWLAASCHAADEDIALQVQRQLVEEGGSQLLILAPRFPDRRDEILAKLADLPHAQRSQGEAPNAQTQVYLADTFSEMGLWYACSAHALIGGSFCDVEGHNPWEALQLGCAVMHGPRVANFAADYAALNAAQAAGPTPRAEDLYAALQASAAHGLTRFERLQIQYRAKLNDLTNHLLERIRP